MQDNNIEDTVLGESPSEGIGEENFGAVDVGNEILDASGLDQTARTQEVEAGISLSGARIAAEDEMLHTDNAIATELSGQVQPPIDQAMFANEPDIEQTAIRGIDIYRPNSETEMMEEDDRANLTQGMALADTDIEDNYLNEDEEVDGEDLAEDENTDPDLLGDDLIDTTYPSDHVLD